MRTVLLVLVTTLNFTIKVEGLQCHQCYTHNYPQFSEPDPVRTTEKCKSTNKSELADYTYNCSLSTILGVDMPYCGTVTDVQTGGFARTCMVDLSDLGIATNFCKTQNGRTICVCDVDLCNSNPFNNSSPFPTSVPVSTLAPEAAPAVREVAHGMQSKASALPSASAAAFFGALLSTIF